MDALLVFASLALFALAHAYVLGCERLRGSRR